MRDTTPQVAVPGLSAAGARVSVSVEVGTVALPPYQGPESGVESMAGMECDAEIPKSTLLLCWQ